MNENYSLEELEAYLYGELSAEKAKKLEEEIKTDLALRSELEALKISREAVEMAGWKSLIAQSQSEFLKERSEERKVKPLEGGSTDFLYWTKRIAASLAFILVATGSMLFLTVSPESITADQVDYQIPVMRSAENTLSEIQGAFSEKDYQKVIDLGKQMENPTTEVSFLMGMAHLELKHYSEAEKSFLEIENENRINQSGEFADQVDYYLVHAYLSHGQPEKAETRMRKILNDPQHTYHGNFGKADLFKIFILKLKN